MEQDSNPRPVNIKRIGGEHERPEREKIVSIGEEELQSIKEVAQYLRMTTDQFLTDEVTAVTPEEARGFLKAFAMHASTEKVKLAYYLLKGATSK